MAETGKRSIIATLTLNFASITAGTTSELTGTVNGVQLGQVVSVSAPSLEAQLVASGYVSAVGVVTVRVANIDIADALLATPAGINPASQDFIVTISSP